MYVAWANTAESLYLVKTVITKVFKMMLHFMLVNVSVYI